MNQIKRLMVITGGTGGHVFPGLVVARYLIDQGWKVRWIGTSNRIEADLVPKHGIDIDFIHITGISGKSTKELLLALFRIFTAYFQARSFMKAFKPDVVLGMGGYVSGPSGLAAWSLGIPIVLHEQNSVAGLTNKWLAKIASKVTQAFPGTLPNAKVIGNPIRIDILSLPKPDIRLKSHKGPLRVLVIGGSQGAHIFNKIMPKVAEKLNKKIIIWHQSGKKLQKVVENSYLAVKQSHHKITEFINNMSMAYDWADIIICRSGALTVSEISALGLAAIFVPFNHKDHHQYRNAFLLEKVGAAKIFDQNKLNTDVVVNTLSNLNREILLDMAKRAFSIGKLDATKELAKEVNCIIKS